MKVRYEAKFAKDLRSIGDAKLLANIKDIITDCKQAKSLAELKHVKKLQGHGSYCLIRIGEYRLGLELDSEELIFVRCLHRKDIYRYFP